MEAASGRVPFVGTWVHTGFLNVEGAKMSKSLGNFYTIRDVLARGYDPNVIRLFMLQSHYRSPINFSWENLDAAQSRLRGWKDWANMIVWQDYCEEGEYIEGTDLIECLCDDLNTPKAIVSVEEMLGNLIVTKPSAIRKEQAINFFGLVERILGIKILSDDISKEQKELVSLRQKARDNKDFVESDRLRDELKLSGLEVRDTESGQIWSRV